MATSSLSKSFVISTKEEADTLAKMFEDSMKNPRPIEDIGPVTVSNERLKEIINAVTRRI